MSFPRPVRRLAIEFGLLIVGLLLGMVIAFQLWPGALKWIDAHLGRFKILLLIATYFVICAGHHFRFVRIRRAFKASGGCLCTECAHNLAGLGEQGNCPECGQWFNIEVDRIAWRASGIELKKAP